MLSGRMMRWAARWLEHRGLGTVADTLDTSVASSGDVGAMHAIARRALAKGEIENAIAQLEKATALKPEDASLWCSLGAAYRRSDGFDAARKSYERALTLKPEYPQVLSNLGEWCVANSRAEEALEWFDKALACDPDFFEARLNKVAALFELARYEDARKAAESLVEDEPERPEPYLNLGNVLIHTGKAKQGIKQYKKALELRPGYPEAHFNLATLLGSRGDLENSIGYLERQIKERGETILHLGLLAAAHQAAGHVTEAEKLCRRIFEKQPDNITALVTLGSCLSNRGDSEAALPIFKRVLELDKSQVAIGSNIVFEYNNSSLMGREEVFRRHQEWAASFETSLLAPDSFLSRDRDPGRKLRIGYVSGDFVNHPVGALLRDILPCHDRGKFEIHCFSMVLRAEEVLPEIRAAADKWEDIFFLSDEEVVDVIRKAEIDILIDLTGHTAFHRLLAFARRPAPVQVEWIGYFHSTGMKSIDYFITDPHTSPFGGGQLFSETPVYLPHSRFCYSPPVYAPEVMPVPVESFGSITFGSFNRLSKITDDIISAWASILHQVSESRLVVKAGVLSDTTVKERLLSRFIKLGISPDRLDLREGSPHIEMLAQYGEIDIALDTFPFNGGITTLEALWMGVPVVTIAGNTVVSRQTVSALANIGLADELAFPNIEAYIQGAVALANDRQRLSKLRQEIRPRMAASPLRQPEPFVRDLEALYRRMWEAWCRGEKLPSDIVAVSTEVSS